MPAGYSVVETWESRSRTGGTEPACTLIFQIASTGDNDAERLAAVDDDAGVLAALALAAPSTRSGLPRQTMRIERNAHCGHVGIVEYHFTEFSASEHSFDTTGGTAKIFRSFSTIGSGAPPGKTAPNNFSLIGVTQDSIEGVDVVIPAYASKITKRVSPTIVTDAYRRLLFLATGTVNISPFKEFAPGECLFLGAAGTQVNSEFWQLTFAFAGSPNLANIQIPTPWGAMTVSQKRGWDYLWVRYVDRQDVAAKAIVKAPCAWFVEQTYRYTDHNFLGV